MLYEVITGQKPETQRLFRIGEKAQGEKCSPLLRCASYFLATAFSDLSFSASSLIFRSVSFMGAHPYQCI